MPRGDISHRDLSPLRWRRAYLAVVKASGLHPGMPARVACDRARMGPAIADVTRKGLAPISLSARPLLSVRRAGGLTFWLACTALTYACAELPGTPNATELFRPPSEVVSSCTAYRHASDAAQSAHSDGVDWHCEPNPEFWVTPASAQSRPLLLEGQLGLDLLEDLARGGLARDTGRQASPCTESSPATATGFGLLLRLTAGSTIRSCFPNGPTQVSLKCGAFCASRRHRRSLSRLGRRMKPTAFPSIRRCNTSCFGRKRMFQMR